MTDSYSTCTCQVCGTPYKPTLNKDGSPRKTKYSLCADKACYRYLHYNHAERKKRYSSGGPCAVDGCETPAKSVGFCGKHYARYLKYSDPLKQTTKPKVRKNCEQCGTEMLLPHARAKKQTTCSRSCASLLSARVRGQQSRRKRIVCACCHAEATVTAYKNHDRVRFCSVQCRASLDSKIYTECAALRRIASRKAIRIQERVKEELEALRRIGRNIRAQGVCSHCSRLYSRNRLFQRYCSETCRGKSKAEAKARYRDSESYQAARRRGKSRRRAVLRGCEHESIDPIKVFDRDRWRCHLCGIKTPQRLRGTTKDDAPELEHIISLADGGTHTWGNVACSCRRCNIAKGAGSRGQLGLGFAA